MSKLKEGDKVTWNSPQGKTKGTVEKKLTKDTKLGSKTYRASKDNPKVKVKVLNPARKPFIKKIVLKKINRSLTLK